MKLPLKHAASEISAVLLVVLSALIVGCGSRSSGRNSVTFPPGEEVVGLVLEGLLANKINYKLGNSINIPNCRPDSVNWTDSELYFGLSSVSFTKLLANQGLVRGRTC